MLTMALLRQHWSWHCQGDIGHGVVEATLIVALLMMMLM
jgi:hypothetical protein